VETFAPLPLQKLHHYYAPSATNPHCIGTLGFFLRMDCRPSPFTSAG